MTVEITSAAQLRDLLGTPTPRVLAKERAALHDRDRQWLDASPFCLVATAGADGTCDVSPKGDPPGFALVLDDRTIAIPERPGNRRADGYRNILENPHVGLIFLIPGRTDTLRINGRARLLSDAPWFDQMVVQGHRPVLAIVVEIEQIFYHCAKAFLRSQLWQPEAWPSDPLPSRARLIKEVEAPANTLADLERHYGPDYARNLYA
ncbi:phosphohydrolase [Micromonospora sonchi]|uniref:Phosphohydrolase n=1 Tax=Micromonospora sonchi TaxID=1763543 RepID=A0A917TR98_9ACTN|nr:pyridoxamine 5'-phosphate oxidase family protein [Micromonospora sonchi]GGM33211.1 phosphohydrolase [Micromonospora sonchi]